MLIFLVTLLSAVVLGALAYAAARRWPAATTTPQVPAETVAVEVERHPGLASILQRRLDPRTLTGLALTAALVVIVGGLAGIGLLFAMVQTESGFARWDLSFARFGADHASEGTTDGLRTVSLLGGTTAVLVIAAVVSVAEYLRLRNRAVFAFLLVTTIGQFLVSNLIKLLVGRERPDILHLTGFSGSSFPSGHATAAAATLMAVALLLGRRQSPRVKAVLAGLAAGLAGAVAASRVLLGVHWFTDVLAGLLLGWLWFAVCSIAFGARVLRFGAPVEVAAAADVGEVETSPQRGSSPANLG